MGRKAANTVLLRARIHQETHARVELALYSQFEGRRKYGAMGDLIESLLIRWLREMDEIKAEAEASTPN